MCVTSPCRQTGTAHLFTRRRFAGLGKAAVGFWLLRWIWGPGGGGVCGWRGQGGYQLWDESGEITPSLCTPEEEEAVPGKGFCGEEENTSVSGSVKQGGCSPTDFCIWQGSKVCVCRCVQAGTTHKME